MPAPRKLSDDALLGTAARLFAEHGYEGTSISMLVDELGVTRPTLYTRVASKRALFDAVYERAMTWYEARLPELVPPDAPPRERLHGLIVLQLEAIGALRDSIALLRWAPIVEPLPEWKRWWHRLDDLLLEVIHDARASGDVADNVDPVVLKHAFWAVINDLPNWYRPGRLSIDDIAEQLVTLFVRA
ncbi:MAG: TetR/AcrR family transcriptional regulator [Acidimicrobiia bacterium]